MRVFDDKSRCSQGNPLSFRWFGNPSCEAGEDVAVAVEALFRAVSGAGRVWNPYAAQMTRSEFKRRIIRAQAGKLKPVDEVKAVDIRNPPPLYEIRWAGLSVANRAEDGSISHVVAEVRMYHSEPRELPQHLVAHHAHEKLTDVPDVNAAQNQEIRTAIGWHRMGVSSSWGVA